MAEKKLGMTEGPIGPLLLRFALPLFLGNLFQQLYNAVDSLVVGNFCGVAAVSGVCSSASLCHQLFGFFQGSFIGSCGGISRYWGAGDRERADKAIHTTVVFSLCIGTLLSVFGVVFTPTILRWMGTPENVLPNSIVYFRFYCAGLLGLVLYNTANGIFQALGDSRHPLYYLMIAAALNAALDLLFVGAFDWGVAGAALATVLGQVLSAMLGFARLMSGKFPLPIRLQKLLPDRVILAEVFRLGLPSGVQNCVINIANVVVQSNINAFHDNAVAGCGSYSKIEGFVFLPITSLTLAITTFVSQNLGAKQYDRVKAGAKQGAVMTVALSEVGGIAFFVFAPVLIGLFSKTPEVVAFGVRQARVESLFYCFLGFSHAAASILRGAGHAVTPMAVMLAVWCLFRITYITIMVRVFQDITVIFTAYPVTWSISSILFAVALWRGDWLHSKGEKISQKAS